MSSWVAFSDVEQHGAAWMEFDTGLTYYYERGGGVHAESPNETRIYGTKGGLRFAFPSWDSNDIEYFHIENNEPVVETLTVDMSDAPEDSMVLATHFLDCLDGAPPMMTVQLAAKHMDILFRILGK
jgi:predicted dehydrogenase